MENASCLSYDSYNIFSTIQIQLGKKGKGFPYSLPSTGLGADPDVQAVSPQVTISQRPGGRLSSLSASPAVTFPAAEHHRPSTGTKLYCLVTEAHRCEQLAQGCYTVFAPSRICTQDLLIASLTLYLLSHCATGVKRSMPFYYEFSSG